MAERGEHKDKSVGFKFGTDEIKRNNTMENRMVRFLKKYPPYNVGEVALFPSTHAADLIHSGRAVYHQDKAAAPNKAELPQGTESEQVTEVTEALETGTEESPIEIVEAGDKEAPVVEESVDTNEPKKLVLKPRGKKAEAEVETKDKTATE